MKCLELFLSFIIIINLSACQSTNRSKPSLYDQASAGATDDHLRTIILNGEELTEYESGQFISWECRDYSDGGNVLVELGHIELTEEQLDTKSIDSMDEKTKLLIKAILDKKLQFGFVLYDGTNKGGFTLYARRGLNHRWDWGPEVKYSFIIKPDGTGLFYDFTTANDGTKEKADDIYKCRK